MFLLDDLLGWMQWYRRLRGGVWVYHCCPDGGWIKRDKPFKEFPRIEDYDAGR